MSRDHSINFQYTKCIPLNEEGNLQQLYKMGNQQVKNQRQSLKRRGYNRSIEVESENKKNNLQTLNQSLESPSSAEPRPKYHSIDYGNIQSASQDTGSLRSQKRKNREDAERDQILQKLSQKNEQLRRQLKKISDQLTEQLRHKKFVPKKKGTNEQGDSEQKSQNTAGIRRELQNGYKQVEMYKRTIAALQGKQENDESDVRVKRLENNIASIDSQINEYIKKVEGLKKVTKVQDKVIQQDINDDLIRGVQSSKKEVEELRNNLKELQKKERQREVNYKKQQAYLFEVQKKWRQMNGDYFPELKKRANQALPPPIASRVAVKDPKSGNFVNLKQYAQTLQQLNKLKAKHEDYNKRINALLVQKNKFIDDQSVIDENIRYSDRIIEALKLRLKEINKIFKPTKKSLFGYDSKNNYDGTELQSEYNGGVDEIQREIQDQINQDKFDIKHLIANIPKPARPKVVIQFEEKPGKGRIQRKPSIAREVSEGGMIISGEKSQPKKWGSALTRIQEKGRQIRKEAVFDDNGQFNQEAKPLIIGINIWVNKNNAIMGLQAIYLNEDQIRYGTKSSPAADGFLQRYDLQTPDYLKNITGAFSQQGYLQYLVLYSKQGKIGTFGFKNQGQQIFTFGLSSQQRPFRIFGASFIYDSQPRLNRIGIQICPQN